MTEINNIIINAKKLSDLNAYEYQYLYEEGKLNFWDKESKIIASCSCKAIMSFASTNNSYRWGLYPETPTLDRPAEVEQMAFDVTEEKTQKIAMKCALKDNAELLFAGTMLSLKIYLSCHDLTFDNGVEDETVPWHIIEDDMQKYSGLMKDIIETIEL